MDDTNKTKLYTTEEVAQILQVDPESVRRYTRSGELQSILLGGKFIRIDKKDLDNFILQRKLSINTASKTPIPINNGLAPVKAGPIWHSPINVYWHLDKLVKKVPQKEIDTDAKYQKVREARTAAIGALAMYAFTNRPAYVQLYTPDPPDALIMQPSNEVKGQLDITLVEITSYNGRNGESLFEQLKRTKIPENYAKYSKNYILMVDLYPGMSVDVTELNEYMLKLQSPFPVWVLQEVAKRPDTIAEMTIVNPEIWQREINIGKVAHVYQKLGIPDVIQTKRTGNEGKVRLEYAEKYYKAPWNI